MLIGEAVELGGAADRISSHVFKVDPITYLEHAGESDLVVDLVEAIAGLTPDRIIGSFNASIAFVQHLRRYVLMIEYQRRKIAIDTIVDIDLITLLMRGRVLFDATTNDLTSRL